MSATEGVGCQERERELGLSLEQEQEEQQLPELQARQPLSARGGSVSSSGSERYLARTRGTET